MVATLRAGMAQLRLRPVLRLVLLVELISGLYSEGFDRLWQKHILEKSRAADPGATSRCSRLCGSASSNW